MVNYVFNFLFRVPFSRAYAKITAKVHLFNNICKFFLRKNTHFIRKCSITLLKTPPTRERPAKDPRKWTHPCPPYKTTPKIRDFSGTPEGREPIPQAIYRGGNAAGGGADVSFLTYLFMSKTTFGYPIEKLCGKISRHSRVIHACTAKGEQITYLQGTRDLVAHPITSDESANHSAFATKQKSVAARLKPDSSTYAADVAAFRAQYATGYKTLRAYLWHTV